MGGREELEAASTGCRLNSRTTSSVACPVQSRGEKVKSGGRLASSILRESKMGKKGREGLESKSKNCGEPGQYLPPPPGFDFCLSNYERAICTRTVSGISKCAQIFLEQTPGP
jgi:hypothetical protein